MIDHRVTDRIYYNCGECHYIYLDPPLYLSLEEEKRRYGFHQNEENDQGYLEFLNQLWKPLKPLLEPKACGLDFGCGPHPSFAKFIEREGFSMELYDPLFFFNERVLGQSYDFIVCTEAIEHFFSPRRELDRWKDLLKKGGVIGVMTRLLTESVDFPCWYYRKDPTHVGFYSVQTMQWVANHWGWKLQVISDQVVLFGTDSRFDSSLEWL